MFVFVFYSDSDGIEARIPPIYEGWLPQPFFHSTNDIIRPSFWRTILHLFLILQGP